MNSQVSHNNIYSKVCGAVFSEINNYLDVKSSRIKHVHTLKTINHTGIMS